MRRHEQQGQDGAGGGANQHRVRQRPHRQRTLAAVTDNVNSSKSDRDPAYWLPPNTNDTCRYIGAWIAIKTRWQLTIDTAETTALNDLITGQCSGLAITP